MARWLVWAMLILAGGTVLAPLLAVLVTDVVGGLKRWPAYGGHGAVGFDALVKLVAEPAPCPQTD